MVIKTFKESISGLILLLAPITVIVCALSLEIVSIVYLRGEFTSIDAFNTSQALIGFAIGFTLIAIREMYIRLHFSYQDTKMPMISNVVAVVLNAVLSIILAKFIGILGISLATSVSAILTIMLLNKSVKKYIPDFKFASMFKLIAKVLIACLLAFEVSLLLKSVINVNVILEFIICAVCSGIAYIACLHVLKCTELIEFVNNMKLQVAEKFRKNV